MNSKDAQKQIADKIKDVDNFLVTVNANPTVDELSAALGITLVLNDMGKHATAVFSGAIPPAITFLDPQKTFENTVDSLRDFIIALDKEKADHLRYKVDGDMVKIFITPYKTTISDKDLDFSQGDYNVEMVLAIGVQSEDDLDNALADHGRILHDATVASLSLDAGSSEIGTINWQDTTASSYSEMLVSLVERIKDTKNLMSEQVATAFLTGIVAATDRFSNTFTTSETMTVAAQLMSAGANQQLIATKLEEAEEVSPSSDKHDIPEGRSEKVKKKSADEPVKKDEQAADGTMIISHLKKGDVDEVAEQVIAEQQQEARLEAEEQLAAGLANSSPVVPPAKSIQDDLKTMAPNATEDAVLPAPVMAAKVPESGQPAFGGTFNATSEQAAREKATADDGKNHTILSHETAPYVEGGTPSLGSPVNSFSQDAVVEGVVNEDGSTNQPKIDTEGAVYSQHAMTITPPTHSEPTLAELDAENRSANIPAPIQGGMPPMPDFSTLPALPTSPVGFIESPLPGPAATSPAPVEQPLASPAEPLTSLPTIPETPVTSPFQDAPLVQQAPSLTPAEQEQSLSDRLGDILPPAQPNAPLPPPNPNDPSQFQIPGQ